MAFFYICRNLINKQIMKKDLSIRIYVNPLAQKNGILTGKAAIKGRDGVTTLIMKNFEEMYPKTHDEKDGEPFRYSLSEGVYLTHNYSWDVDNDKRITSHSHIMEKEVYDFLCSHPLIIKKQHLSKDGVVLETNTNKNLLKPLFVMEVLQETLGNDNEIFVKTLSAMNIVNDMSIEKRKDIIFYYGGNPTLMTGTEEEINSQTIAWLVNPTKGVVLQPQNIDSFLELRLNDQENGKFVEFNNKVIFEKSLKLALIYVRDGVYYSKQDVIIGYSEHEALVYILNNKPYLESLKQILKHNDYLFNYKREIKSEVKEVYSELKTGNPKELPFTEKKAFCVKNGMLGGNSVKDETKLDDFIDKFLTKQEEQK